MRSASTWLSVLVLVLVAAASGARADEENQHYTDGETVELWVNKVGPFRNPQETYLFFSLPWCIPESAKLGEIQSHFEGLGEALQGYELRHSGIDIAFKRDVKETVICTSPTLTEEQRSRFSHAIMEQYWYQMFLDDLPIWGMVGEVVPDGTHDQLFLYTHKSFSISYNNDQIIEVNLTSENPVSLWEGGPIDLSYSVTWVPTDTPFDDRFKKYLDFSFFEHQIHWFSIFNSFMMVVFLVGMVAMIMVRTVRKDYARYGAFRDEDDPEDGEGDFGDDSGWKQVHGDVFRAPASLPIFSALLGSGAQLASLVLLVTLLSIVGNFYEDRGTLVSVFFLIYVFTSFIGGYVSGGYYCRNGGKNWIQALVMTGLLFPGVTFTAAFLMNFVAIAYGSLAAIPFWTMVIVLLLWILVSLPLTVIGTVLGRNFDGQSNNPCRIAPVPKNIPEKAWFAERWVHFIAGGILPFGSIFIEMYFVLTSFWHYKYYYVYGFMLLVFGILTIVVSCVSIVSTYFLLNAEDYHWQWTSWSVGMSTSMYVYLYSIYYFLFKTHMSGFFQTSFYFGYMALFSFALGLMCAAIAFLAASKFVRTIYANVKVD